MPGTTLFPGALDTFPTIEANTREDAPGLEHDVLHNNAMVAIAALQAKVGVDNSNVPESLDARIAAVEDGKASVAGTLSQFAATSSAQLAAVISDETGTGALVFAQGPTLVNPIVGTQLPTDNSTKAASTAFVAAAVAAGSGGSGSSDPRDIWLFG